MRIAPALSLAGPLLACVLVLPAPAMALDSSQAPSIISVEPAAVATREMGVPATEGGQGERTVEGLLVEYAKSTLQEQVVLESVAEVAEDISEEPSSLLRVDEVDGLGEGLYRVDFENPIDEVDLDNLQNALLDSEGVVRVEPDYPVTFDVEEFQPEHDFDLLSELEDSALNQAQASSSWGLDRIDQFSLPLDSQYRYRSAGESVRVYVVDTGVRSSHQDFGGRVAPGYSEFSDAVGTEDCHGHGTHVAGTIAGAEFGVAKAATIVPVRVLDCNGMGTFSGLIAALRWIGQDVARQPGPAVVNMSLGGPASYLVNAEVDALADQGISVVVAAGNSAVDACEASPASAATAITVGASDQDDRAAWFSNFGDCVDIYAPGVSIRSDYASSDVATATASGTSMASPHVAGAVALRVGKGVDSSTTVASILALANPQGVTTAKGGHAPLLFTGDIGVNIINGTPADIDEFPWQVALVRRSLMKSYGTYDAQFCGGSIIDSNWILTAAHCVDGESIKGIGVVTGIDYLPEARLRETTLRKIVVHPDYDDNTFENDLALLQLSTPLSLGTSQAAIALPESNITDFTATITGWGADESDTYPQQLMKATVVDASCAAYGGEYVEAVMLCAGDPGAYLYDTCQGDSGGPMASEIAGNWTLLGVTSWGNGCAVLNYPGIYTRVSTFVTWVWQESGVGVSFDNPSPANISGSASVGSSLSAVMNDWDSDTAGEVFRYQWLRGGKVIKGATSSTYTPGRKDIGRQLSVRVTGSAPGYTSVVTTSEPTAPVVG